MSVPLAMNFKRPCGRLIEHIEESGKYQHPARAVGPPAAKEKLLKKFLFGFSSKRFDGRRERIADALLSRRPM